MRVDRSFAIKLRLQGLSYTQIQKRLLGVSKSTLSLWLKDVVLSREAREAILRRTRERSLAGLLKRNKHQTILAQERKRTLQAAAKAEITRFSRKQLFFVGLALYWAEGHKRPLVRDGKEVTYHPVSLTNSDPLLVKTFIAFLERCCDVPRERMKIGVRIFSHLNEAQMLRYWREATGLPAENFKKVTIPISRSSMGKRPFNRLPFGVVQIRINDTRLYHRIMGWIEGMKHATIT